MLGEKTFLSKSTRFVQETCLLLAPRTCMIRFMSVFLFACLDQCFLSAFTLLIRVLLDHQLVHDFSVPMLQDKISRIPKSSVLTSCNRCHHACATSSPTPFCLPRKTRCHHLLQEVRIDQERALLFVLPSFFPTSSVFPTFELERLVSILKRFVSNLSVFPPSTFCSTLAFFVNQRNVKWVRVLL